VCLAQASSSTRRLTTGLLEDRERFVERLNLGGDSPRVVLDLDLVEGLVSHGLAVQLTMRTPARMSSSMQYRTSSHVLWTALTAIVVLALSGCAGVAPKAESDYTIRVTGFAGSAFSGTYGAVSANGSTESHTVDGTVPATYHARGMQVSVVFQTKMNIPLNVPALHVEILRDGSPVKTSETKAAYGVVTLAAS
jgi:hypothetical protein